VNPLGYTPTLWKFGYFEEKEIGENSFRSLSVLYQARALLLRVENQIKTQNIDTNGLFY
jgi:hypothetical protein